MIRTATRQDLSLIRSILSRANDAPYDIEPVLEEKCFGPGIAGEPRIRLFEDAGVAVRCGIYLRLIAVDRDRRGRGIGSALLRDAAPQIIAAEPGNYFTPGVLPDQVGFFLRRGYREAGRFWNLHVELNHGEPRAPGVRSVFSVVNPSLLAFVRKEFGAIWAFEVSRAQSAFWIDGTGFAVIEANNRGLGTFGPAGVINEKRGQGFGRTLVQTALTGLSRLGYERAIIPWTDAIDFYRRSCGAEPAHQFVTLTAC